MLKIGILGAGRIGQVHARTLRGIDSARVVAISDFFADTAAKLANTCGAETRTSEQITARAGKAIFCEKPVDMSADRIRDCIKAVETAGVPFMTAFNRRFDPNFASAQKRIADGQIGDVEIVTILSRDPSPPPISYIKSSGGIFRDMMIHDFDMARFLLGEEPVSVFAVGAALVDPAIGEAGDVDTAAVTLTTASGKICQISNSRRATYGYDQRIEVHGSKGMIRGENVLENTVQMATEAGFATAPTMHFFLERYEQAYALEMVHFVQAVGKGGPVTPSIEDGLRAQLIADAATESWQTGQPVAL